MTYGSNAETSAVLASSGQFYGVVLHLVLERFVLKSGSPFLPAMYEYM